MSLMLEQDIIALRKRIEELEKRADKFYCDSSAKEARRLFWNNLEERIKRIERIVRNISDEPEIDRIELKYDYCIQIKEPGASDAMSYSALQSKVEELERDNKRWIKRNAVLEKRLQFMRRACAGKYDDEQ